MTYPFAELKFSNLLRTATGTSFDVQLYRVDNGGTVIIDGSPHQINVRTKKGPLHHVDAPVGVTKQQVVTFATAKMKEWVFEQFGFNLPDDRLVCSL